MAQANESVDAHVLVKYDLGKKLGKGAYGIVWRATDKVTGKTVALKKIYDAFQNATDAQRTFREIMFLQGFAGHENIVRMIDVMKADNDKDIYLTFEYMETDLHAVIHANILEDVHKRYIMYQLLRAMKFIHTGRVLHRDLKPSNILLNSDCLVKVADFGLARSMTAMEKEGNAEGIVYTDYVATRWYRAPEILLGSTFYTPGVDMWSVGCILGEVLGGRPMFPGSSTMNQLERIIEVTGQPTKGDIDSFNSPYASTMLENLLPPVPRTLAEMYPNAPADALDLLRNTIHLNPSKRLTAQQALEHAYVAQFHNPKEEPESEAPIAIPLDDNVKLTIEDYRNKLYTEVCKQQEIVKERHHRRKKEKKEKEVAGSKKSSSSSKEKKHSSGSKTSSSTSSSSSKDKKEKETHKKESSSSSKK